jgi:hypothetical protein
MVTGLWAVLFPQLRDADELTAKALRQDLRSEAGEKLLSATSD